MRQLSELQLEEEAEFSKQLKAEIKHTEHHVHIEDLFHGDKITEVAKEAINLLKQLGVPIESMFANVANIPEEVETYSRQESSIKLPQVFVAGIPFYIDHEKKQAIPRGAIDPPSH